MCTETTQNITKTFKFSFPTCSNEDVHFKLEVPVEIPYNGSTRELVQRVLNMFHIPVYLEDELNESLGQFVSEETKTFHNERDKKLIDQLKNSEINVEGIVKNWEKLFKENVVEFAEQKGTSDEEVFAAAYHKLVHSPALETILQVENSYAITVRNTLKNRDEDIAQLTLRQTHEMEELVAGLNVTSTERDINEAAARHFEEQSLTAGRWGSQLDALHQAQRAHHRAWIMDCLRDYQAADTGTPALSTPADSPLATFGAECGGTAAEAQRLEESFTIHLGGQLKQTHNIRIAALDVAELCSDTGRPSRRLQSSLGLYSSELCGALVLCELSPRGPLLAPAAKAALLSTEHHFADVQRQLEEAAHAVRNAKRTLRAGDVLLTRHSNLADVHVLFHLVAEDAALRGELSSRHAAILGLRSAVRAAAAGDVTALTLPLLLRTDADASAAWCSRRAELVLKCVKGFMLEAAGAGGAELRTLQLAVPPTLDPAVFASLAALLPAVFRVSTPLRLTPP